MDKIDTEMARMPKLGDLDTTYGIRCVSLRVAG
jgi:hypothetical protein